LVAVHRLASSCSVLGIFRDAVLWARQRLMLRENKKDTTVSYACCLAWRASLFPIASAVHVSHSKLELKKDHLLFSVNFGKSIEKT
jgi:hypothetical protein